MVGVAGPARLIRVMSQLGSLLPPIDRLDRHVDIQDPRLTQYRFDACPQLAAEPFYPGPLLYPAHRPAHHVFTDRAAHVQQRRIEPISPHRVDMRITPMSTQDRERRRAQDIHHRPPPIADIVQRRIAHKALPSSSSMQKLCEKQELPLTGHRRLIIKLRKISTTRGVHWPRKCPQKPFTLWVNRFRAFFFKHPSENQHLA